MTPIRASHSQLNTELNIVSDGRISACLISVDTGEMVFTE